MGYKYISVGLFLCLLVIVKAREPVSAEEADLEAEKRESDIKEKEDLIENIRKLLASGNIKRETEREFDSDDGVFSEKRQKGAGQVGHGGFGRGGRRFRKYCTYSHEQSHTCCERMWWGACKRQCVKKVPHCRNVPY